MPRSQKDILAGLTFVCFGMAFAVLSIGYGIGTTVRMGSGYFPFFLGGGPDGCNLMTGIVTACPHAGHAPVVPAYWSGIIA